MSGTQAVTDCKQSAFGKSADFCLFVVGGDASKAFMQARVLPVTGCSAK
jgi:hypothetical protein